VGGVLALLTYALGKVAGFDRDRAFYATILIVVGHYYVLFAAEAGSTSALIAELAGMTVFVVLAVAGFKRLMRVLSNANATGHEVIDLRALRPLAMRGLESWNSDVVRTIHGYDAVVIWKGAHASSS
jgi:hypothetical protein